MRMRKFQEPKTQGGSILPWNSLPRITPGFHKEESRIKKNKIKKSEFLVRIVDISPVVLLDKGLRLYQKLILPGRNYSTTEHSEPFCFTWGVGKKVGNYSKIYSKTHKNTTISTFIHQISGQFSYPSCLTITSTGNCTTQLMQ